MYLQFVFIVKKRHKKYPSVIKLFFNSSEHEISFGHKNKNTNSSKHFHAQLNWACSAELSMKEVLKFWQYLKIYKQNKFHAQLRWAWQSFIIFGPSPLVVVYIFCLDICSCRNKYLECLCVDIIHCSPIYVNVCLCRHGNRFFQRLFEIHANFP